MNTYIFDIRVFSPWSILMEKLSNILFLKGKKYIYLSGIFKLGIFTIELLVYKKNDYY